MTMHTMQIFNPLSKQKSLRCKGLHESETCGYGCFITYPREVRLMSFTIASRDRVFTFILSGRKRPAFNQLLGENGFGCFLCSSWNDRVLTFLHDFYSRFLFRDRVSLSNKCPNHFYQYDYYFRRHTDPS